MEKKIKLIRTIKINPDKCIGCKSCEAICSAFHCESKFAAINPQRSRIRVFRDEENDLFVPVIAGAHTDVECLSRHVLVIGGKEYEECSFCRSSCSSRSWFKEPDPPHNPLKCDVCGEPLPEGGPLCVQWCYCDALTYGLERHEEIEKREEEVEEGVEEL